MVATRIGMLTLGLLLAYPAMGLADEYTKWVKDEKKQTYSCDYVYKTKDGKENKQTVVIYYADKDRKTWAYFYNADLKPWARCAVPGNAKYKPKAMYWEALKPSGDGYEPFKDKTGDPYPAGYCPAPKDGKSPIPLLPLPPK